MFNLRDISIRNKLILLLVFTSVLVLGIFFTVFIITDIRSYKQRKVDSMISLAQVVASNSASTLQFQDQETASNILLGLHNGDPEIVQASILDSNGNIFAGYIKPGAGKLEDPATALKNKQSVFSNDKLLIGYNIINENKKIGKVFMTVELSELKQIIQSKYKVGLVLLMMALGFSFLIAIILQSYISKRILFLANTMKEASKTGDYNKYITDKGKDEISTLVNVFNNLMLQVRENQRRKDEFISIASHELRTPLTSIKGYLQLLNEIEEKNPNKQFVQKSLDNAGKLEKLIKDLLDVSKIQSGQLELNLKEFNIDQLLDETIAAFQMVSSSHQIIRIDDLNNEVISADRQRIEQVVANLLSNAIKYSPGENKIIVYSKKTETELIIKIRDFGMGIPEDELSNIFQRFYRTKNVSITITGFGLGLYICKDIIKRHNGKIWVETEDKGSAFYFSLPLKRKAVLQKAEQL